MKDYMTPGFVFHKPCSYCGSAIRWTREDPTPDDYCSESCRETSNRLRMEYIRTHFRANLLKFLADNHATIRSGCQAGCDLTVTVGGSDVAEFCCSIPESQAA